jgi:FkbM family methyltransferase
MFRNLKFKIDSFTSYRRDPFQRLNQLLSQFEQPTIVDVGANVGQFGVDLRRTGYKGRILSFEPVSDIYKTLCQTASRSNDWECFNFGFGARNETLEMNISKNDGLSSSLLKMHGNHEIFFGDATYVSKEMVRIRTIDSVFNELYIDVTQALLKLDIQGYESFALAGAVNTLKLVPYCFLEVSIMKLYEGESSILSILNQLNESNHQIIDLYPGLVTGDGKLIQVDILTSSIEIL